MKRDPFTLKVALSQSANARGELYLDDGESYDHREGNFVWREFIVESTENAVTISSKDLTFRNLGHAADGVELTTYNERNSFANTLDGVQVERIVILGLQSKPSKVVLGNTDLEFTFENGVSAVGKEEGLASKVTIENPGALITHDWTVVLRF